MSIKQKLDEKNLMRFFRLSKNSAAERYVAEVDQTDYLLELKAKQKFGAI